MKTHSFHLPFSLTKLGALLLALVPVAKEIVPQYPVVAAVLLAFGTLFAGVGIRNALDPQS